MYISSQRYFVQRFLDKGRQKGINALIAENQHTSIIIREVDSGTLHKSDVYNEIAASIAGGESQSQQDAMITLSEKECDLIDHNFNSNISHANASTLDLERMLKVSDGIVAPLLDIDHLLQEICVTIQEIVDRESQSKLSTAIIIPRQETKKIVRQISKACIYEGACVAFLFAWIVKKKYILLGKSSEISLVIIVLSLYLIFVRNNVIAKVI